MRNSCLTSGLSPDGFCGAAADAEDVEEVVPEGLAFGGFAGFAPPFLAEGDGAVANLIPRQWHGRRLPLAASAKTEVSISKGEAWPRGVVWALSLASGSD